MTIQVDSGPDLKKIEKWWQSLKDADTKKTLISLAKHYFDTKTSERQKWDMEEKVGDFLFSKSLDWELWPDEVFRYDTEYELSGDAIMEFLEAITEVADIPIDWEEIRRHTRAQFNINK